MGTLIHLLVLVVVGLIFELLKKKPKLYRLAEKILIIISVIVIGTFYVLIRGKLDFEEKLFFFIPLIAILFPYIFMIFFKNGKKLAKLAGIGIIIAFSISFCIESFLRIRYFPANLSGDSIVQTMTGGLFILCIFYWLYYGIFSYEKRGKTSNLR